MEYLMTYGWAILIIAVVLGALFSLGVFNGANFAPKAPPGACQVFRPNGPGTTSFVNLEGVCNGELPEYVAQFNGNSRNNISATLPTVSNTIFTISVWFYPTSTSNSGGLAYFGQTFGTGWGPVASTYTGTGGCGNGPAYSVYVLESAIGWYCVISTYKLNAWNYFALIGTPSGSLVTYTFYLNGNVLSNTVNTPIPPQGGFTISTTAEQDSFIGDISNVQIYNTSLSGPEVNALYLEGIGGAPIDLQNLVGWWPLNGNANDYSGNGNNGQATNVIYTSSWTNGYTTP